MLEVEIDLIHSCLHWIFRLNRVDRGINREIENSMCDTGSDRQDYGYIEIGAGHLTQPRSTWKKWYLAEASGLSNSEPNRKDQEWHSRQRDRDRELHKEVDWMCWNAKVVVVQMEREEKRNRFERDLGGGISEIGYEGWVRKKQEFRMMIKQEFKFLVYFPWLIKY